MKYKLVSTLPHNLVMLVESGYKFSSEELLTKNVRTGRLLAIDLMVHGVRPQDLALSIDEWKTVIDDEGFTLAHTAAYTHETSGWEPPEELAELVAVTATGEWTPAKIVAFIKQHMANGGIL